MTPYAVFIPIQRRTRDHRVIQWWECELTDERGSVRDPLHPFFSLDEARSWATSRGYEVRQG